ncbi:chlorhexidine efflux transporter [Glutamicibacter ardleyensis]|uniref:chlorhexidine efflux transporter n=1 Tax=Glutamicibacter ardleyensis TaxID=225894 RepID=UPI003FD67968
MSPILRRIVYVFSYELFAILLTSTALILMGFGGGNSGIVAITSSAVALIWNYAWTSAFEAWENAKRSNRGPCPVGWCTRWVSKLAWCSFSYRSWPGFCRSRC